MAEREDEERNSNNVITDTFIQPHFTTNAPREETDVANEMQISSDILTETIKLFIRLTLQSTINDSVDVHSKKNDQKSNPLVSTHTSDRNKRKMTDTDTNKGNSPHKLLTNREIPEIIQGVIPPVNQTTAYGVATNGWSLHAVHAVIHKKIVTGATRSAAGVLKDPLVVNWKDSSRNIPVLMLYVRTDTQIPKQ